MLVTTILYLLYFSHAAIGRLNLTLEPRYNNVLEGSSAVFTCTVSGRVIKYEIRWQAFFYDGSTLRTAWDYPGIIMSNTSFNVHDIIDADSGFDLFTFGNYSVSYAQNMDDQDVLQLRIDNVTKYDGYFKYSCTISDLREIADLTVWTWPTSKPQCSFKGDIPDVISSQEIYQITLICFLEGGNPRPYLNWLTEDQNRHKNQIGSVGNISVVQNITASDHGQEYICKADILATPDDPLTCSIIPYNPMPIVSVSLSKSVFEPGSMISISCNNTGASTPDTHYLWYINNVFVNVSQSNISITEAQTYSTLYIENSIFLPENTEFTCEGVIPLVARANASVIITFGDIEQPTTNSAMPNEASAAGSMFTVIIAAASGGGFLSIIVIFLICYAMKRKRSEQTNDEQQEKAFSDRNTQSSKQNTSNEDTQYTGLELTSINRHVYAALNTGKGEPGNENIPELRESAKTAQSGMPIYAHHIESLNIHTKEGSSKSSKEEKPHNEGAGFPDSLSDYVNTVNDNADQKVIPVNKNTEGLTYANLEMTSPARSSGVSEDMRRTENITVYSEVTMY